MRAHQFDHSGRYVGSIECQKDQLESERQGRDIFMIPPNATLQEPPEVSGTLEPVWSGSLWILEEASDAVADAWAVKGIDHIGFDSSLGPALDAIEDGANEPPGELEQ